MEHNRAQILGLKIKELRETNNLNIKDFSKIIGMTPRHISQVEKGLATISFLDLEEIARIFGIGLDQFSQTSIYDTPFITRRYDQEIINQPEHALFYSDLSNPNMDSILKPTVINLLPGKDYFSLPFNGEAFLYVIEGTIDLEIDGETQQIYMGDKIHYCGKEVHRCVNSSKTIARMIYVITAHEMPAPDN